MSIINLLAAFGGGVFGSLIGGTTAFIFTGVLALLGIAVSLAGGGDVLLNEVAFGPFFGPHVAFAGAAAATAYIGREKTIKVEENLRMTTGVQTIYAHDYGKDSASTSHLVDGADVATPLFKTKNTRALLVGGLFGTAGYIINYLFADILNFPMDTMAFVIVILGVMCRFMFGTTGLTGRYPEGESRFKPVNETLLFSAVWGVGLSAVTGYAVLQLGVNNIGFAISATSLVFLYSDNPFPVTHHVTMVAGFAAATFGNVWAGIIFGVLALISGDYINRAINTYVDTHIDMPATLIAFWSFIILGVFG